MKRKGRKAKQKKVGEEVSESGARRKGKGRREKKERKERKGKEKKKGGGESEPTSRREQNRTTKDPELRYEK